jgi:hypothetical protein
MLGRPVRTAQAARVACVGRCSRVAAPAVLHPWPCPAAIANTIQIAVSDFTDVDMSGSDLDGVQLDGVRWSPRTRWPSTWRAYIEANSVPIAIDLYEVRSSDGSDDPVLQAQV